jgi:hypothetical protein
MGRGLRTALIWLEVQDGAYAADLRLFVFERPFITSASSTQRFTVACSLVRFEDPFCALNNPEKESTEGRFVSRFVGEGKGRQITTLLFARDTTRDMDAIRIHEVGPKNGRVNSLAVC